LLGEHFPLALLSSQLTLQVGDLIRQLFLRRLEIHYRLLQWGDRRNRALLRRVIGTCWRRRALSGGLAARELPVSEINESADAEGEHDQYRRNRRTSCP
jgi:hypothetical protein